VAAQSPLVREAQRHLAGCVLQPICELVAEESAHLFCNERARNFATLKG
jgi:hypothetical protein